MDFGQRLKSLRAERNLTQQNLGDAVGVSTVTIRAWERNAKKPAMDALLSLGRALNISIDTLLDFHLENTPNYALVLTSAEKKLLSSYQALDNYGKKAVDAICVLEKERVDAAKTIRVIPKVIDFQQVNSERFIPRYTTPSAAGSSVPLDGVDFEMILVDSSVPEEADYAVYIQGNSMYPYIHDGDMVYVKKTQSFQLEMLASSVSMEQCIVSNTILMIITIWFWFLQTQSFAIQTSSSQPTVDVL